MLIFFLDSVYLEDSFWSSFQWIFKGFARKLCLLQIPWSWNAGEGKNKAKQNKQQQKKPAPFVGLASEKEANQAAERFRFCSITTFRDKNKESYNLFKGNMGKRLF